MKTFFKNNFALVLFVLTIILDEKYNILSMLIKNPEILKLVKMLGSVIMAYLTPHRFGFSSKEDIGGGGIANPTRP